MALLLGEDYERLAAQGLTWSEVSDCRFLILNDFPLPVGLYTVARANILVIIEARYPEAGHDMFWTAPQLVRSDGASIPNTENSGSTQNHTIDGVEYHRWSRHWSDDMASRWIPGKSNVGTIVQRITWALSKSPLS
ncbi:E2/UBC family protein [Ralstonia solanacearum P673]|uniref:E2/UBC family protein n=1 Tax=Ralstonia solanacearum TaxID=305 RepID=UPI00202A881B|nr:E2/UBC family protein [Ralstonia solanacearum]MCL9849488.1 hypothetical protein [Ralstonia solanacearum]MCL9852954.1 hypothetical protein [Ralstonia solanacearum]MCL9858574.1 hypothetical protein [Ralstonia solanacearum]MCL9866649.1 hypothetical protein [Ralstonia solanacearum]MCL9867891.1 hypothetical protein [Ralstonia solanacearum]